jgi:hypothetical protein
MLDRYFFILTFFPLLGSLAWLSGQVESSSVARQLASAEPTLISSELSLPRLDSTGVRQESDASPSLLLEAEPIQHDEIKAVSDSGSAPGTELEIEKVSPHEERIVRGLATEQLTQQTKTAAIK